MRVVVIQRRDVLAQRVEPRLQILRQPIDRGAQHIGHDACGADLAVADERNDVTLATDRCQGLPQHAILALAAARIDAIAENAMRYSIEIAADLLERVGVAVDDGFQ